jgi:hypothetical protein
MNYTRIKMVSPMLAVSAIFAENVVRDTHPRKSDMATQTKCADWQSGCTQMGSTFDKSAGT